MRCRRVVGVGVTVLIVLVLMILSCSALAAGKTSNGWYWPVGNGTIGDYYGWLDYSNAYGGYHLGQDFTADLGDDVRAIAAGTVVKASMNIGGYGPGKSAGGAVVIRHATSEGDQFLALYGHVKDLRVNEGDKVAADFVIAKIGPCDPTHLHFGIHPGSGLPTDAKGPWRGYTPIQGNVYGWDNPLVYLSQKHPKSEVAKYARHIVQQKGDTKKQKTSWYVSTDLRRLWIPDAATFSALRSTGAPKPDVLAADELDALPDQKYFWAAAGNAMTKQRTLRREMALRSANGKYAITLRSDGNVALTGPGSAAIWDAEVSGIDYLVFQKDGNLAGYKDGVKDAVWSTQTAGKDARRFVVRNDGVAAVLDASGKWLWSTKPTTGAGDIAYSLDGAIYTIDPFGLAKRQLTLGIDEDSAPAWSPDRGSIAFVRVARDDLSREHTELWRTDVTGVDQRRIVYSGPSVTDAAFGLAWSPDGRYLAGGSRTWTPEEYLAVTVLDLQTLQSRVVRKFEGPYFVASVDWSPDSTSLLVTTTLSMDPGSSYVLDASSGAVIREYGFDGAGGPYRSCWSSDGKYMMFCLWNVVDGVWNEVRTPEGALMRSFDTGSASFSYSPDSSQYVIVSYDEQHANLERLNADGSAAMTILRLGPEKWVRSIAWK
jgi:murein DD-endopeptidase MepM/ murein hydrolase activator NlpD/WD40 repeat protein